MPLKDPQAYRDYKREYMRRYRARDWGRAQEERQRKGLPLLVKGERHRVVTAAARRAYRRAWMRRHRAKKSKMTPRR